MENHSNSKFYAVQYMQFILCHSANLANMAISVRSEWSYVGEQQFLNFEIRRIRPKVFVSIIHRFSIDCLEIRLKRYYSMVED